jgi:hypothetical protein
MSASKVHLTVNKEFKIKLTKPWSRFILWNTKFARVSDTVKIEASDKKCINKLSKYT